MILLFLIKALPIANLCFSPPDKNLALIFALSSKPIIFNMLRASSFGTFKTKRLSSAEKSFIRLKS